VTGLAILFAQLAAPVAAQPPPDIEFHARVKARRVEMEQQGEARIVLHAEPGQTEPARVERSAPRGQTKYRNLTIDFTAAARIADPADRDTDTGKPTGDPE
jgi:hypothetical protein